METLATLSVRAFVEEHPICQADLPQMQRQYRELLSCYTGLQVSLDCAKHMSSKVCKLLDLFSFSLKEILQRLQNLRARDPRRCVLFLDLELSRLYRTLNSAFNDFHVPRLHSVLQDLEDSGFDYLGYRFSPKYDLTLSSHEFLKTVHFYPPVSSTGLCDLVMAKTSRIVTACNETCYERQVYSGLYIDSLDTYYTARSDMRGISRSISLNCTVTAYKYNMTARISRILSSLRYDE